ncbi:uncharacterized protein F4812DRAFT_471562 [Daldinia caldariorum]|uniref:uncharacterized protein n=1 Tax=Daldinia caldariorum TaxID=326644 RepID=UPI0020081144|nr:uncharacterized protein F4812DRAFT_471562 [Daldinia caldariorum]KAI1467590.1 hypothetical protein F4812DRAFT_471562 [Daldinia caldariorum]
MQPQPGPATLWGILESENSPSSPGHTCGSEVSDYIPFLPSPAPNPAAELFGEELQNLEMPPFNGDFLASRFCRTATSRDLVRINYGLFHDNYPNVRDVADPSMFLERGIATLERTLFGIDLGVIVARGTPILVHVEMLRPLPHLYWMFVDPRDGARYRVVHVLESPEAWKIALLAVYGTEDFDLREPRLMGEDYIDAVRLAQRWAAVEFVRDALVDYFKSYCTRLAVSLRRHNVGPITAAAAATAGPGNSVGALATPQQLAAARAHELALQEIQRCFWRYSEVSGSYRTLPVGAFGAWAVRAINQTYMLSRLPYLTHTFRQEITLALIVQANAYVFDYTPDEPIFLF